MALADVYDALTHQRCYKPAMTHEEAMAIILAGKGTHFDPYLVDLFVELEDEIIRVSRELDDKAADERQPA